MKRCVFLAVMLSLALTGFAQFPDRDTLARIARDLDLIEIRKARLAGRLVPVGKADWDLDADLGATVTQPCVATLAPVRTRLDEAVARRYRADAGIEQPDGETEMPEDDSIEPLPAVIDLVEVFREALSLALPLYPRADAAAPVDLAVTEPGATPIRDAEVKPFSGLAALRRRLDGNDG